MLSAGELQSIADACIKISNEIAGTTSGFVSVRKLLERFGVAMHIRPLLVEGMLATIPDTNSSRTKLAVLLDSETFGVATKEVATENDVSPLPTRFRTTVAHELLHSLAFRPGEFGLRFQARIDSDEARSELVKAIEAETERLTPLLLWPEKALNELIATRAKPITPGELANLAVRLGISRQMAVTRFRLRRANEGIIYAPWLADVAIGMGEWVTGNRAVFRKWPLFANFDRNIAPSFLYDIAAQDRLPAQGLFEDEHFALNGGEYTTVSLTVNAGVKENRSIEKMPVVVSVESATGKPGAEFLFVVRKRRADDASPAPLPSTEAIVGR